MIEAMYKKFCKEQTDTKWDILQEEEVAEDEMEDLLHAPAFMDQDSGKDDALDLLTAMQTETVFTDPDAEERPQIRIPVGGCGNKVAFCRHQFVLLHLVGIQISSLKHTSRFETDVRQEQPS